MSPSKKWPALFRLLIVGLLIVVHTRASLVYTTNNDYESRSNEDGNSSATSNENHSKEDASNDKLVSDNEVDYQEIEPESYPSYADKLIKSVLSRLSHVYDKVDYFSAETEVAVNVSTELLRASLSPVMFVPGYGGSKLEMRWNKTESEYNCPFQSDWRLAWCDPKYLIFQTKCLVENIRLEFESTTNTTHSPKGVEVRVKKPELLESVETITENALLGRFNYFTSITKRLISDLGYKRDVNIRAAPYDFRKAPNELEDYFNQLAKMIEQMYDHNSKLGITLICHSMGCNNLLYFLQRKTSQWKARYIRRMISLAAPWAGSMNAFRAVAFGDNLHLPLILREDVLNIVQKSLPSTMYLLPNEKGFGDKPLVRTVVPYKVYRAVPEDYERLFEKLKHPDGYKMYLLTKDLFDPLRAPEVEVWCLYGHKIETLSHFDFKGDFPNAARTEIKEDGDGTVATVSSSLCRKWAKSQNQPVHLRAYSSDHIEMLDDEDVVRLIEQIQVEDIDRVQQLFGNSSNLESNKRDNDNTVDEISEA